MLQRMLARLLSPGWKPLPYTILKDSKLSGEVYREGYKVVDFLNADELKQLQDLYTRMHDLRAETGAVFNTLFSEDKNYRYEVFEQARVILKRPFEHFFKDYKNLVSTFLVKVPGPASEVQVHQDMSSVDETRYSPLSVWIPLQDIDTGNGPMCFIPRSHFLAVPHRDAVLPSVYKPVETDISKYLSPVCMKAGQAIIFDPRTMHYSPPNLSGINRVALVSGILPAAAEIVSFHKKNGAVAMHLENDDYPLFSNSYYTQEAEPGGKWIKDVEAAAPFSRLKFRLLCKLHGIKPSAGISFSTAGQVILNDRGAK